MRSFPARPQFPVQCVGIPQPQRVGRPVDGRALFPDRQTRKALAVGNQLAKETLQSILYYTTPIGPGEDDIISKKLSDDAASTFLYLIKIYDGYGQKDAADALEKMLKGA